MTTIEKDSWESFKNEVREDVFKQIKQELDSVKITAGELRSKGFFIPRTIPDCAETERSGIKLKEVTSEMISENEVKATAFFDSNSFNWINVTFNIKKYGGEFYGI